MDTKDKQTEANKKWQEKNRERAEYLGKQATSEDILEMEQLISEQKVLSFEK